MSLAGTAVWGLGVILGWSVVGALPTAAQGGLEPPKPVRIVVPGYPEEARQMRQMGEVAVEVDIDPAGHVTRGRTVSGPEPLRVAAELAARQWRFEPPRPTTARTAQIVFAFVFRAETRDPLPLVGAVGPPLRVEVFTDEEELDPVLRGLLQRGATLRERTQRAGSIPCDSLTYEPTGAGGSGHASIAAVRGVVRDSQDMAVPGTCVGLFSSVTRQLVTSGKADDKGEFAFVRVPAGEYRLVVWYPDFGPLFAPVTIKPGGARKTLEVQLASPSSATPGTIVVR
jgi:TonB family protein